MLGLHHGQTGPTAQNWPPCWAMHCFPDDLHRISWTVSVSSPFISRDHQRTVAERQVDAVWIGLRHPLKPRDPGKTTPPVDNPFPSVQCSPLLQGTFGPHVWWCREASCAYLPIFPGILISLPTHHLSSNLSSAVLSVCLDLCGMGKHFQSRQLRKC